MKRAGRTTFKLVFRVRKYSKRLYFLLPAAMQGRIGYLGREWHEWTDRVDTCTRDPLRWVDKTDVVLPQTGRIGKEGEELRKII